MARVPSIAVVGVVRDVKLFDLSDRPENQCYFAFAQMPVRTMSVVVRTSTDPLVLAGALRKTVSAIDRELPISDAETMQQKISDQEAPFRITAQFSLYFALLALFLAGMGIYGVTAYLVESRTREIGIRIACGAEPRSILLLVLSGSLKLVVAGILLGLAGAWGVTRLLSGLLNGVRANSHRLCNLGGRDVARDSPGQLHSFAPGNEGRSHAGPALRVGLWKFARPGDSIRRQTLIFFFIPVAVVAVTIVERRLRNHCTSFGRCCVHFFPAEVSRLEHKVLDCIRWNIPRVLLEDDKVRQFAWSN